MSDVVISKKHYDDILADRDRLQRERDALAEVVILTHKFIRDYFGIIEYENLVDARAMGFDELRDKIATALALDDGFPP